MEARGPLDPLLRPEKVKSISSKTINPVMKSYQNRCSAQDRASRIMMLLSRLFLGSRYLFRRKARKLTLL